MAYKEMFFLQVFGYTSKNSLKLIATYHARDAEHAVSRARAYSEKGVPGALAFSQMIDEKAEDALEPTMLVFFGHVPPEASAHAA